MAGVGDWLESRTGVGRFWRAIFHRRVPVGLNWSYTIGAAALFVLGLQTVTGILLGMNYSPSPDRAYDSILYISETVPFGSFVRGLHHWGASAMVVLVVLHLLVVFFQGAYKRPREVTWLAGVVLLLITLGFGFTGYLLPWDQKAYWATTVGTNMPGTMPFVGPELVALLRGGTELGAVALSRFYSIHVLVLPALIGLFVLMHLALVIWHGVSVPARLWHRGLAGLKGLRRGRRGEQRSDLAGVEPAGVVDPELAPAMEPLPDAGAMTMDREHERYKAFKARGPRFWPEVIAEDAIATFVVFAVIVLFIVAFGVPTEARADPTDTTYIPRPEWYFMFLFQLVTYFPGNLEWIGVVVIPGLFVLLLFALPFFSRGPERRAWRRPIGTAVAAVVLVGAGVLTVLAYRSTPPSVVVEDGTVLTSQQLRGKQLIVQQGCMSCHVIGGQGARRGPWLDGIGQRMTAGDIHFFMEKPKAFNPAASMEPVIPPLTHEDVEAITQYLLTLDEKNVEAAQQGKKEVSSR
jgi:ubiquinol-cytochrome c reductase cytochrome b subunit